MKIALCEGSAQDRDRLQSYLGQLIKSKGVEADICIFENADDLLESAKRVYYSVLFLDISLPGTTGMEAALALRKTGSSSPIIFTTVSRDYMTESYGVWAVHYLIKPVTRADAEEAFGRALRVLGGADKTLEITVSRHSEYIPFSDIYYIEGSNRNCVIYTRTGICSPYGSVQDILRKLSDSRFVNCHRSYIINLDHIIAIQGDRAAMRNDILIPIRRGDSAAVRKAYEDRRFSQASEGF